MTIFIREVCRSTNIGSSCRFRRHGHSRQQSGQPAAASYGAAKREVSPGVEHRQHRSLTERAEDSRQPTHQREQRMQPFKSPGQAQRLLAAHVPLASHFRLGCHLLSARAYRQEMAQWFQIWRGVRGVAHAASASRTVAFYTCMRGGGIVRMLI
jgi:hypothetical protein